MRKIPEYNWKTVHCAEISRTSWKIYPEGERNKRVGSLKSDFPSIRVVNFQMNEQVIRFTRLWVSSDGHTHLQDCTMAQVSKKPLPGGKAAQYVRDLSGVVDPTKLTFTQMAAGSENPWHQCPTAQFVVRGSLFD